MKKYIIIATLAIAYFLSSCDIERLPGDRLPSGEAFKTIADAEAFRIGYYAIYRSLNYNHTRQYTDYQADIINAVSSYGNRNGIIYLWQDALATESAVSTYYSTSYSLLSNLNNLLENIDDIKTNTAAEATRLQNYKGEAYLMRASAFHGLVKHFAKAYNPATASTDLGVPLTLTYDTKARLPRASMKDTYDQIQADLNQAKALMNVEGSPGSVWLTKDFANAIQARISLDRQEWAAAIAAADLIINKYALADTEEKLINQWTHDTSTEIVVGLYVSNIEGRASSNSYISYNVNNGRYMPDYVPSKKVIDAYKDGDFRKSIYLVKDTISIGGLLYPNVTMINKYPSNPAFNSNPAIPLYVHKPKLFMSSEAYLIKAEAQARGNTGNAIATLNILSAARNGGVLSGDAMTLVKEERFREMLAEGQRLHDLRRWGEPLNRTGGQTVFDAGGLFVGNQATTLQKPTSDKMWVWEFPLQDLQTNFNLVPNWR